MRTLIRRCREGLLYTYVILFSAFTRRRIDIEVVEVSQTGGQICILSVTGCVSRAGHRKASLQSIIASMPGDQDMLHSCLCYARYLAQRFLLPRTAVVIRSGSIKMAVVLNEED
jgi:hypothetical protein